MGLWNRLRSHDPTVWLALGFRGNLEIHARYTGRMDQKAKLPLKACFTSVEAILVVAGPSMQDQMLEIYHVSLEHQPCQIPVSSMAVSIRTPPDVFLFGILTAADSCCSLPTGLVLKR